MRIVKTIVLILTLVIVVIPLGIILWFNSWFLVDSEHSAVVSRNGQFIEVVGPGKYSKIPLIDHVTQLPSGALYIRSSEPKEFYLYTKEKVYLSYEIEWTICSPESAYYLTVDGDYSYLEKSIVRAWSPTTMVLVLNYKKKHDLAKDIASLDSSIKSELQKHLQDRGVCIEHVITKI